MNKPPMTTTAERAGQVGATLGVDVGGTFTDAVVVTADTGDVFTAKAPTTPYDQSEAAVSAALEALVAARLDPGAVGRFVHGMTVTTNALLERDLARTALLATSGFTDIEELGRQDRPSLYDLDRAPVAAIVPPELRFAVPERCGPEGPLRPLDEQALEPVLERLAAAAPEAVAVCLLFSFRHPEHERRVGELVARRLPGVHVSLSHEVVGTFREYERCATTVATAALGPRLAGYMERLGERAAAAGLPEPQVMLSNGGTCPAGQASRRAAHTVLSGPSGGAVAVASLAADDAGGLIGFDMGGTSTDVSVLQDGALRIRPLRRVAGRPLALPAADIATVGAGGGSIGWRDSGGAMRVGPRSAGAHPGPACYGHGGELPTVTDANLVLGYLGDRSALAGGLRIDRAAAERAVAGLARELDVEPVRAAAGIVEIADLEMTRATTAMTVARGIDPRGHTLVAFGGAGPMHAARVARRLGVGRVVCPPACGVLSAVGLAIAGGRTDVSRSLVVSLDGLSEQELSEHARALTAAALDEPAASGDRAAVELVCELRYRGQSFELPVPLSRGDGLADLAGRFHAEHEREFGYRDEGAEVELVTLRATAAAPRRRIDWSASDVVLVEHERRQAWFGDQWRESAVLRPAPDAGVEAAVDHTGPAIVELDQATVVVPPGWRLSTEAPTGGLLLTASDGSEDV
jgi:N-methylhydantoinase A